MEGTAKILEGLAALVSAVAWPALIGWALLRFSAPLLRFLDNLGEARLKGGGVEVQLKSRLVESLAAATAKQHAEAGEPVAQVTATAVRDAQTVADRLDDSTLRRMQGQSLLWVDDNPLGNLYERRALEAVGLRITQATSTEAALKLLRSKRYALVISDMHRPGDERAGFTLLEAMRAGGDTTPVIFYHGRPSAQLREEALRLGGNGSTTQPNELLELVSRALA